MRSSSDEDFLTKTYIKSVPNEKFIRVFTKTTLYLPLFLVFAFLLSDKQFVFSVKTEPLVHPVEGYIFYSPYLVEFNRFVSAYLTLEFYNKIPDHTTKLEATLFIGNETSGQDVGLFNWKTRQKTTHYSTKLFCKKSGRSQNIKIINHAILDLAQGHLKSMKDKEIYMPITR